jgi:type IV secretion system protein VirD4
MGTAPNRVGNVLPPGWVEDTGFFISLVFMGLTVIQNIYRLISKQPKFNIFKAIIGIFRKKPAVGFIAELKLDGVKNLSGFVFGKYKGKYVTKKENTDGHMMIIGGAGSGKSSCIAIPTLMSWQARVFAIDVKGELYAKTSRARDRNFIKVFNPSDPSANGYNPFYMLKYTTNITQSVMEIALSIIPLPADIKEPYWVQQAQQYLTGAILYFYGFGMSFSETMINIQQKPSKELATEIMESQNAQAKMMMSNYGTMDERTLGGIVSEVSRSILPFATDSDLIQALGNTENNIKPNDLENGYDILCCIDESKIEQWRALLTTMCNQFLKSFERRAEGNDKPILFLLDEFPRLGKIDSITSGLATLRSKKIQIALFVQSKSQLNVIYGKDMSEVIADICSYKAILKASEPNTQEWCSKLVGTYDKTKLSSNINADMLGIGKGTGEGKTTEEKRIIKPEEFAYMQDIVCIFPTGYQRISKTPYYQDSTFIFKGAGVVIRK